MVASSSEPEEGQTTATQASHRRKSTGAKQAKHMAPAKKKSFKKEKSTALNTPVKAESTPSEEPEPKEPESSQAPETQINDQAETPSSQKPSESQEAGLEDSTLKVLTSPLDVPEPSKAPVVPLSLPTPLLPAQPPSGPASSESAAPALAQNPLASQASPWQAPVVPSQTPAESKAQASHFSQPSQAGTIHAQIAQPDENPYLQKVSALHGATAPKEHHTMLVVGIVAGVACALLAVYVGVALFFETTFMPNTTLNGKDVSLQNKDEVGAALQQELQDYSLAVDGEGLSFAVNGNDVGLGFNSQQFVNSAIEDTSPWAWPLTVWSSHAIEGDQGTTYDETKLSDLIETQVATLNETAEPPTNASVAYDDASKQFLVTPDALGTQLDSQAVASEVSQAFKTLQGNVTVSEDTLLQPTIKKNDPSLAEVAKTANSYLNATITLKMNGQDAGTIDSSQSKDWIVVGEDLTPTVNEEAVAEWGRTTLSQQLDTIDRDRTYTRPDGKEVTVNGGTYGWSIDSGALAPLVAQAISSGSNQEVEVPVSQSAAQPPDAGGKDWGNRYIDVDLSEQYVRMYGDDNNVIWEAPCVSGDVSEGHTTPTGVYSVNEYFNKESPASVLVGYYPSGEKEYESPVSYWMPFIDNNVGLHDANWRGAFGGSINYYNGSHGCVNLPVSAAGELCELINQGDVVVVHY